MALYRLLLNGASRMGTGPCVRHYINDKDNDDNDKDGNDHDHEDHENDRDHDDHDLERADRLRAVRDGHGDGIRTFEIRVRKQLLLSSWMSYSCRK